MDHGKGSHAEHGGMEMNELSTARAVAWIVGTTVGLVVAVALVSMLTPVSYTRLARREHRGEKTGFLPASVEAEHEFVQIALKVLWAGHQGNGTDFGVHCPISLRPPACTSTKLTGLVGMRLPFS